jgi:TonB family protein
VALEQFKTQVLLLHSEQSTLDVLSAGFNDRYTVHFANSGIEALDTLGQTPIHVIVSAHDLPGMSGLDALREAKKRSPDTIGILLAGTDGDDGLEALVGDKEVFAVIRGDITANDLKELIDSATQRVRLLALSESANDQAANPDEPAGEHIVMETSENGSTIISDGTGRMPALKPEKVAIMPNVGGNQVDVLVLTKDEEFLATIRDSARGLHNIHHANTPTQAEQVAKGNNVGVLVTDAAMVGSKIEVLTQSLRKAVPRLVAVVAGRRDDGEMLMDLINRGQVYRFLLKPVSPGRARLAIEASVKHHMEADDSAFKGKPASKPATAKAAPAKPKAAAPKKPKVKAKARPQAKASPPPPKPPAKPKAKPTAKPKAQPEAKPEKKAPPTASPRPVSKPITASRDDDRLSDPFGTEATFAETMTDIAGSVGKSLSGAGGALSAMAPTKGALSKVIGGVIAPLRTPRNLAIAGGLLAVVGVAYWVTSNWDSSPTEAGPEADSSVPTIAESDLPPAEPAVDVSEPAVVSVANEFLDEARSARGAGYIFSPPGENAVELYVAAMSSAPDDPIVASELEDVVDQTLGMIEKALLEQRGDDAAEAVQMVRLADPDNSRLLFLDAQIKQMQLRDAIDQARVALRNGRFEDAANLIGMAEAVNSGDASEIDGLKQELAAARSEQEVGEVLAMANQRLNENKLIAPSNDNARYYYELALSNAPDNPAAQQGITIIASKLVLQARQAIDQEQFPLADTLLQDAEALDPASSDLAASKSALLDARNEKELEQQAAADRQAEAERLAAERKAQAESLAAERKQEAERLAAAEKRAEVAALAALEKQAEMERELELQRQADAQKRAELERQLKAQVEAEAEKRAELERQLSAQAELEAEKRAQLERELDAQRQAEADKRAELESQLAARKAEDQKRASAELAAAAVAAANARSKSGLGASVDAPPTTRKTRTVADSNRPGFDPSPEPEPQAAAMNQLPVERRSPPIERTFTPTPPPNTTQGLGTSVPPDIEIERAEPEPALVAITQLKRTNYVAPKYPRAAQRRNTSGWVDLGFTVARDGTVHSIEIIESTPGAVFDEAATKAVSQWRFDPVMENGRPVEKRAGVRMMFSLE